MIKLKNQLLPHQEAAFKKLKDWKVGALFMEQGTGKTITMLAIALEKYNRGKINSIIWLCPCSAKSNIKTEIIKQAPIEFRKIVTICGIETLSSSIRANTYLLELAELKNCLLVVDESLLVKNYFALRTKNIKRIAQKCNYKFILNGTPISRNEADLFSQFYILDWRILGYKSYWSFSANHLEYDDKGRLVKTLNVDNLVRKISPYSYQVKKSDCITLPPKKYNEIPFYLGDRQYEEYCRVADELMFTLDEYNPDTIYRLFSGLQAVLSGKELVFNDKKTHFECVEMFKDPRENPRISTLLEILGDEKTIIFCKYSSEISQLCEVLGNSAVRFDGKITLRQRTENLEEFKKDKKYLIANRSCAGYSLNLQFCNNVIYMSNDWDLGTRLQSEDRVHRYGQEKEVDITDIYASGTLDERIMECLSKKTYLLDEITEKIQGKNNIKTVLKNIIFDNVDIEEVK